MLDFLSFKFYIFLALPFLPYMANSKSAFCSSKNTVFHSYTRPCFKIRIIITRRPYDTQQIWFSFGSRLEIFVMILQDAILSASNPREQRPKFVILVHTSLHYCPH